jgi:hypothetical protein
MRLKLFLAVALLVAPAAFAKTDALSLVPNDAVTVGVVRLSDMRSSPISSTLFSQTDKVSTDGEAEKFLREAGLQPTKDIDVVVVSTSPRTPLGSEADVLVAADGRFNVDRLTKALVSRGAVAKKNYYILPEKNDDQPAAVAFPDAHLVLAGSERSVAAALASYAAGGTRFLGASGLGRDAARIDPHATAWAIVDVTRAQRFTGGPHIARGGTPTAEALSSAVKNVSTVALWATDTGNAVNLGGFGLTHDAETLQLLEDTLRGALSAMRLAVQDKSPEMVSVLRRFNVSRSDDAVTITGSVSADQIRTWAAKHNTR